MSKAFFTLAIFLSTFLSQGLAFADGEAPPEPPSQGGDFIQTVTMLGIAILFFYFILWRPEQKRRRAMEEQRDCLKPGDRVTAMGIVGTVVKIQEETVVLKMYDGSKLEFLKGAVNDVQDAGSKEDAGDNKK